MAGSYSVNIFHGLPVPEDLDHALEVAKAALANHRTTRPSNQDIPTLTKWVLAKELLE